MGLSPADLAEIVAAFEGSDWQELSLSVGDTRLELSKSGGRLTPDAPGNGRAPGAAPVGAAAPASAQAALPTVAPSQAAPAQAAPTPAALAPAGTTGAPGGHLCAVVAPSIGVFWRSPQPGAPPFVSVGDSVAESDTVCIVEVMKLMSHVPAGIAGVIRAVDVENGHMVEQGQVLFRIEPAA